ncbi:MAG TPA: hypothetical protein VFM25_03280 [Verrucomicrobiae bacterium]|nr:hypothetical protein [Verrucomicrobiae bacterium]
MSDLLTVAVLSDIHYASAAEQARGDDYELKAVSRSALRLLLRIYRRYFWLRYPLRQNHLLDQFLEKVGAVNCVVANGDFSCDSGFVGLSDDAAAGSARECLTKLRNRFGDAFHATFGDHELGKFSFVGARGGMRLASFHRAIELGLKPFWRVELGQYVLIGVASSLIALPVLNSEILAEEKAEWENLRAEQLRKICIAFSELKPGQRVLLFCHDPTALPFLWREEIVRGKLAQVEQTIIGHLHSNLIFWESRILAGMPPIRFLGNSCKKMSTALREARCWKSFHVRLCPSLAGIELLKDGGFLTLELDADAKRPLQIARHRIHR